MGSQSTNIEVKMYIKNIINDVVNKLIENVFVVHERNVKIDNEYADRYEEELMIKQAGNVNKYGTGCDKYGNYEGYNKTDVFDISTNGSCDF